VLTVLPLAAERRRLLAQHQALKRKHESISDRPFDRREHEEHGALLRVHMAELTAYGERVLHHSLKFA
jgi:hypothetical protein